ncbi:MAG: ABC transporter ATP-binding protein/permease [Lachnoclostridium sp.]|jgi:ATP-binding cassette subfamily B protein|nr:ABC transporter ATP-binding protein/permease [Lachnoclostridium sp.]
MKKSSSNNKENKHSFQMIWHNNVILFKLFYKSAPGYLFTMLVESLRNAVTIFLGFALGFNYVLECVEFSRPFRDAAVVALLLFALEAGGMVLNSFFWNLFKEKGVPKVDRALKEQLYAKAREIDIDNYDDPEFYNEYILAVSEASKQVDRMFNLLDNLVSGAAALIMTSGFVLIKDPASLIFVVISFFGTFFVGKKISQLNFKIRTEKNPEERRLGYVNRVFYLNDYAKEMRLNTEISKEMLKDFEETNDKVLAYDKKYAKKRLGLAFLRNYIFNDFIIDILYIAYLVYNAVVLQRITYSNIVVLYWSARNLKGNLRRVSDVYAIAQESSLYMEKIMKFLETEPQIISKKNESVPDNPCVIELKNVSFCYNEKDGYVLKNINMKIDAYSKIAIVGYNGAGKTTLIKLIMRLYDPNTGEILLNGVNIKDYNLEEYRRKIGTVFQDFKIFAATVKENVLLDFEENGEDQDVIEALKKSGFYDRLETMPHGLSTNLTTEFEEDGINLSGGENQKLAVSRVFFAEANTIILDEPSSALDPIAEYYLNRSMLTAAENKSVIFISHRLSTTRIADRIYMLEDGKIIEEGSHTDLLELDGKYAKMWRVQAEQYAG